MTRPRRLPVTDPHWARLLQIRARVAAEHATRGLGEATWYDVLGELLDNWDETRELSRNRTQR